ncbi:diguanylate cyclase, partial [Candidatus Sumerlaeota bacterium]|nr:diguanylate cyclase [Candidatus Sumerlaeota bacterium]
VSNADDTESIVTAINEGANDYVTKPVNMSVLLARMEMHLRMVSMLVNLETQGAILARLAAYDELTGIYNRRSLFDALDAECARSRRNGHQLSVLMIDIDFFKRVNDVHGHAAGDATLREVAQRLGRALRTMDCLGRYGGEEFCAVLPETNIENSLRTAERVRMAVAESPFRIGEIDTPITISIGAATRSSEEAGDPVGLLNSADRALLEAKRLGRNRVCHTAQEAVS